VKKNDTFLELDGRFYITDLFGLIKAKSLL